MAETNVAVFVDKKIFIYLSIFDCKSPKYFLTVDWIERPICIARISSATLTDVQLCTKFKSALKRVRDS